MKTRDTIIIVAVAAAGVIFPMLVANAALGTPRAYWPFDASGATLAPDASGNAFNASLFNAAPTYSLDVAPIGITNLRSLLFTRASSQALQVSRPVQDSFTLCAWFKTTATGPNTPHYALMPLFDSQVGGIGNDFGFGIDNAGKLAFGTGLGDVTVRSPLAVNTGDWTHGCATRNKSNGAIAVYVNGSSVVTGTSTAGNTLSGNPNMLIGMGSDGGNYWNGNMDDLRVYDTVLSSAEILSIANGTFTTPTASSSSAAGGGGGGPPVWLIHLREQNNLNLLGQAISSSASSAQPSSSSSSSSSSSAAPATGTSSSSSSSSSVQPVSSASSSSTAPLPAAQSPLQARTCGRVMKWFTGNTSTLVRLNTRLMKQFGFACG